MNANESTIRILAVAAASYRHRFVEAIKWLGTVGAKECSDIIGGEDGVEELTLLDQIIDKSLDKFAVADMFQNHSQHLSEIREMPSIDLSGLMAS